MAERYSRKGYQVGSWIQWECLGWKCRQDCLPYMMELVRLLKEGQHRKGKVKVRVHVYETGPAPEPKVKERDGRGTAESKSPGLREIYSEKLGGGSVQRFLQLPEDGDRRQMDPKSGTRLDKNELL